MSLWRWLLAPFRIRYLIAAGIVGVSTLVFAAWLFFFSPSADHGAAEREAARREELRRRAQAVLQRVGRLLMIDNDLYDADSGEAIAKNWLVSDLPLRLFYDRATGKVIGRFPRGFVRYGLDGVPEAELSKKFPPFFSKDRAQVAYVEKGDVWVADCDWKEFQFKNARQVTNMGKFEERLFGENVFLASKDALVVKNLNQVLRVNLATGEVKPCRIPLKEIEKRRSPDGTTLTGELNNQFFAYDVATDNARGWPIGRNGLFDELQWANDNRCAVILDVGKKIGLYDRAKGSFGEIVTLAAPCHRLEQPSPDGRYLFVIGRTGFSLVDLESHALKSAAVGQGMTWISQDTLMFVRDVMDSTLRGTWVQSVGQPEKRVSPEPFLQNPKTKLADVLVVPESGEVFLLTRNGLSKMKADGTGWTDLAKAPASLIRMTRFEPWSN